MRKTSETVERVSRQGNPNLAKKVGVSDDDLLRICQRFSPGQDFDLAKAVRDEVLSRFDAPTLATAGTDSSAGALPAWLDLAKLRRRAEQATGGEWKSFVNERANTFDVQLAPKSPIINWMGFDGVDMSRKQKAANARYIAAAAPRTVLALLDALAALQSSTAKTTG